MPNQIGPHLEQRIVAFALGHPGFGPRRISAELAREKWGGIRISEHGVWRVLRRFGLNTRSKRLALIARHADPYERRPEPPPPERCTSTPQSPARRSSSTASTSAGCRAPRAPSGNTPRSTSPPPTPGPSLQLRGAQPLRPPHRASSATASRASSRPPAGSSRGHHRQRLGVPAKQFGDAVEAARRPPALHQGRPAQLQRLRRAPPADDPRGVLAARLRPLAGPQDHRAPTRPRRIPRPTTTSTAPTPDA